MTISIPHRPIHKKGEPPKKEEVKDNLTKAEPAKMVALNFRVSAEFKKDFKIAAAISGITQSDLLQKAFDLWNKNR
jgi:hypothetical protein